MSYIRCLSNPEGLYIWGDGETIEISGGFLPIGCENHINTYRVPSKIFKGLLNKFHKNYHECPCSYKGLKVEEVWVDIHMNTVLYEYLKDELTPS